ncbi:hypothetical protein R1sor_008835 [Riccia sorocarpa]|uniref:Uncharacterized protein n=1 Tax=Riccia sorocarpa TaxID=122646 RepID=A0ABD3H815_9MARC
MERHHPGQKIDFSFTRPNCCFLVYYLIWNGLNLHSNLARAVENMISDKFFLIYEEKKISFEDITRLNAAGAFWRSYNIYITQDEEKRRQNAPRREKELDEIRNARINQIHQDIEKGQAKVVNSDQGQARVASHDLDQDKAVNQDPRPHQGAEENYSGA